MNENLIVTVIGGLLVILISVIPKFIWNPFSIRPVIKVKLNTGSSSSSATSNPKLLHFEWKQNLIIENISKNDVLNLRIIWPSKFPPTPLNFDKDSFIKSFNSITEEIILEKYISYEELEGHSADRFDYFMPLNLKNLTFMLCYENEVGKRFYVRYKRNDSKEIYDKKPKFFKPKFNKEYKVS